MTYYVEQDANGKWYILNEDGFPVSQAYSNKPEADTMLRRIWEI